MYSSNGIVPIACLFAELGIEPRASCMCEACDLPECHFGTFFFFFFFFFLLLGVSVDQAGLELRNPPASVSQVLGLNRPVKQPFIVEVGRSLGRSWKTRLWNFSY
jgi:hypothetical protein